MSEQIQPWPVVKRGSQGHPLPALQYLLRDRGHHVTVDGIFGPKTEAAVEAFQTSDHLRVDGIVGPQTWGALVITVSSGSTGDAVRGVQERHALGLTRLSRRAPARLAGPRGRGAGGQRCARSRASRGRRGSELAARSAQVVSTVDSIVCEVLLE